MLSRDTMYEEITTDETTYVVKLASWKEFPMIKGDAGKLDDVMYGVRTIPRYRCSNCGYGHYKKKHLPAFCKNCEARMISIVSFED